MLKPMVVKHIRSIGFLIVSMSIFSSPGAFSAEAQQSNFTLVSDEMLINPSPDDWLMYSRSYDAQRFSPLQQVNTENVSTLSLAWSQELPVGITETIPIVYDGVMYLIVPGGRIQAMDASNGELIWEYARLPMNATSRSKGLAIYADLIFFTAPDSYVIALDALTGELRWETKTDERAHTSAPLVVDGKVISGGSCMQGRKNCYIVAHDALTGVELWRFYTTPTPGEPGDESWNGAALENRMASTWGLPGSYDPDKNLIYWGVANPMPDLRMDRHDGDAGAVSRVSPADLYSNSTIALNPDTGKLSWYYQHLPGDDADLDHTHERTLVNTALNPDPRFVKWINPNIVKGEIRDVSVTLPEGGGIFLNDSATGEFLWATPFPADVPELMLANIDVETGRTEINWDLVTKESGTPRVVCYWNTRSYWPTAYSPETNSIYTSYVESCREMGHGSWQVIPRPGIDPDELAGIARIDLTTGEVNKFNIGRVPSTGALLTTAGNLVFHGDMSRHLRAFNAVSGELLWETLLEGNVSVSTITYAVNGTQYVAVMSGDNLKTPELKGLAPEVDFGAPHNEIYVFSLPKLME